MRVFIAVSIPEKVREEILRIQEKIPFFKGKKTRKENLHLTLKFLGEIDEKEVEKVQERLRKIKFNKFESELSNLGVFSERFIKIIWLKLDKAENLQKKIDESLSDLFEKEHRFMSHITIARVKNIKDKKIFLSDLNKIKINSVKFKVDKFYLMKSVLSDKGPEYEILKEYKAD